MQEVDEQLFIEDIPVIDLAKEYGSPLFIYSAKEIERSFQSYKEEIRDQDLICYAVKANSNINILKLLAGLGSGFDVVSGNELKRCLLAGADKRKIVFSGVGKSYDEIKFAIENDILSINIESLGEFERILEISKKLNKPTNCALRVNPDIKIDSHKYIETGTKTSKFGLDMESVNKISELSKENDFVNITTVACHIGSQISDENLILKSLDYVRDIADQLSADGHDLKFLDIGGGLGIQYKDEDKGDPKILLTEVKNKLKNSHYQLILEPGRSIVGTSGILLTKVEYIKEAGEKKFAIIDAGMNDLIRPSLYEAWHQVKEVERSEADMETYDLAGPVCETGDVLAKDRNLRIEPNDYLAFMDVGAYGSVMSSNYNSRLKPQEILVTKDAVKVIKKKESFEDLIALEQ
jgi:diaminopimelate decarboxylase